MRAAKGPSAVTSVLALAHPHPLLLHSQQASPISNFISPSPSLTFWLEAYSTMTAAPPRDEQIQNLRKLFADSDVPNDPKAWDQAWINSTTPWDADRPQPALVELLAGAHDADANVPDFGGNLVPVSQVIPKGDGVAVVPGCGRGYDARVFAERGMTSYGVDISSTAVTAANKVSSAGVVSSSGKLHSLTSMHSPAS